ncbi:MAG: DUF559 domain-containing protein [Actinomycetota bacterium]
MKTYAAQDAVCEALAARQQGHISRKQARNAGYSDRSIQMRLDSGRWVAVLPGVYRMRPAPDVWLGQLHAAYLWAGHGSLISHRSAAALHGLSGYRRGPVELSAPKRMWPKDGVICHTFRREDSPPFQWIHNLPTTRVNRTLYDIAAREPLSRLEPAFDDAHRRDLFALPQIANDLLQRGRRGLAGTTKVRRLLASRDADYGLTESELEGRMLAILKPLDIGDLEVQLKISGNDGSIARVDFASPSRKLVIEVDGWRFHRINPDTRRDRARERKLVLGGWRVLRFTWDDVVKTPDLVLADVLKALTIF